MRHLYSTLFILLAFSSSTVYADIIIFDCDGILVKTNYLALARAIGLRNFIGWYNPLDAQAIVFDFFNLIEPLRAQKPVVFHKNKPLPQLLCDWFAGTANNAQLLKLVEAELHRAPKKHQTLIHATSKFLFNPYKYAKTRTMINEGIKIFKKCRKQKNNNGTPRHRLFILSNWDAESFALLKKTHKTFQKVHDSCEGVMISGDVHLLKPDSAIFEHFFETFGIDPDTERCIYIDDELSNIQAAQALGKKKLTCIHCKRGKYKELKKELKQLSVVD